MSVSAPNIAVSASSPNRTSIVSVGVPKKKNEPGLNRKLLFAVITSTIGSAFQHGYHIGILNNSRITLMKWISNSLLDRDDIIPNSEYVRTIYQFVLQVFAVGAVLGSFLAYFLANKRGPRRGLQVINVLTFIALIMLTTVKYMKSHEVLIIARFLIGICAGVNSCLCPIYLTQISPIKIKGAIGLTYQFFIVVSILASNFIGLKNVFGNDERWQWMFIICFIPAFMQGFFLRFFPDTPVDTWNKLRDDDEAEESLAWYRNTWDVLDELEEVKKEVEIQEKLPPVTFSSLFSEPAYRTPLVTAMVLMANQQLSGLNQILYYSTNMLKHNGFGQWESYYFTVGITLSMLMGAATAMYFIDKVGQRIFILISQICIIVVCAFIAIIWGLKLEINNEYFFVMLLLIGTFSFGLGLGGIPWMFHAEVFPFKARVAGSAVSCATDWAMHVFIVLISDVIYRKVGLAMYFFYWGAMMLFLVFTLIFVPELKDKNYLGVIKIYHFNIE